MKPAPEILPPHAVEAEAGCLACIVLSDQDEAEAMLRSLDAGDFYDIRHKQLFTALRGLHQDGQPLNTVTLHQRLKDGGKLEEIGGLSYLTSLPDATPSPANWPSYLEVVKDRSVRRAILQDAFTVCELARDTTVKSSTLTDAARRLAETHAHNGNGSGLTIRKPSELLAMTFDESDRIIGDRLLATGQSLVIAGAGGLGKSRILLQLAADTIAGRQWLGFETRGQSLRWLILQAENSNRRLQHDLSAIRDAAGDAWQCVDGQLFIHTLETDADGFMSLESPRTQRYIADAIRATKPNIIAWDSLYNFGIGDLNKDEDMAATLLALSRVSCAGDASRAIVVLHHALTGRAGAMRATGFDRSSHGRNSKVLFAWTRAQVNLAPGSAEDNETLVMSCGKCSNGKEFPAFAIRLNPDRMIYEVASDFDLEAWESEVAGKSRQQATMTVERVSELCRGSLTKKELARAIMDDAGCVKQYAYRMILKAEKSRTIHFTKATERYVSKP